MTHEAPQWILAIESGQALMGSTTAWLEPVGFRPVAPVDRRPQKMEKSVWWRGFATYASESAKQEGMVVAQRLDTNIKALLHKKQDSLY